MCIRDRLYPDTKTFDEQLPDEFNVAKLRFAVGVMTTKEFAEDNPEGFQKLAEAVQRAVNTDEYKETLERRGRALTYMDPEEAQALISEMSEVMTKYKPLVEASQDK